MKPAFENTIARRSTGRAPASPNGQSRAARMATEWTSNATSAAHAKPRIMEGSKGRWKASTMRHGVTTWRSTLTMPLTDAASTSLKRRHRAPTAIRAKRTPTCAATVSRFCIQRATSAP